MIKAITISLLLITWQGSTILAQKLNQGDFAPQFEILDVFGKKVQISNDNDSKIFIAFMRYVGCPVCNFRTHELIESYQKLKALGYELLVVYESEPETIKKYLQESPVPFQVIADPKRKLYKKYKVQPSFWYTFNSAFNKKTNTQKKEGHQLFGPQKIKRDGKLTGIPADFLIAADGRIERAYYGKTISDHLPLIEIIK